MDERDTTVSVRPTAGSRRSGLHPVNTAHLVMGLAFLGLVAVWAVIASDVVTNDDIRWLMPVPWVVAGAVGLAVSAWSGLRNNNSQEEL